MIFLANTPITTGTHISVYITLLNASPNIISPFSFYKDIVEAKNSYNA